MMVYGTDLRGFDVLRKTSQLKDLPEIIARARKALEQAQDRQAANYNRRRIERKFEKGEQVLIQRDALTAIPDLAHKYRAPFIGPYEIVELDHQHDNYTLALPPGMRLHPVFHVSALRKYVNPDASREISRPSADAHQEFEVEKIIGTRTRKGKRQFLVAWLGYDVSEATWEPEEGLTNAKDAVAEFLAKEKS